MPREFCEGNARLAEFRKSTVKDGGAVVDATWKLVSRLMEGNNSRIDNTFRWQGSGNNKCKRTSLLEEYFNC